MNDAMNYDETILSTKQTIEAVVIKEFKYLVYQDGAPYIKFLLFATVLEFLGACLDIFPFNEEKRSEERFNNALKKLLPNKYKTLANAGSGHYLYTGFRCEMVHRLKPNGFAFTTRKDALKENNEHLKMDSAESKVMILVLEDFYDDIEKAAKKLIKMYENGKAPKHKGDEDQLRIMRKS